MSTKAELRALIKQEARIKTGTNLDTFVDAVVADIMRDYGNKSRYSEVLLEDVPLTLVAGQGKYALPANFQNLLTVRYGRGSAPFYYKTISSKPDTVRRTTIQGYPKYYTLSSGPSITVFPYDRILATDSLVIDYYADPASLYTLETSPFPIPRLESAIKKDAIARIQRFHAANQDSQLTDADSQASFIAAESASK